MIISLADGLSESNFSDFMSDSLRRAGREFSAAAPGIIVKSLNFSQRGMKREISTDLLVVFTTKQEI